MSREKHSPRYPYQVFTLIPVELPSTMTMSPVRGSTNIRAELSRQLMSHTAFRSWTRQAAKAACTKFTSECVTEAQQYVYIAYEAGHDIAWKDPVVLRSHRNETLRHSHVEVMRHTPVCRGTRTSRCARRKFPRYRHIGCRSRCCCMQNHNCMEGSESNAV